MTKETIKSKALELAIIHTILVPTSILFILDAKAAIGWIVTVLFLHQARIKFDYTEFNRVKTYYFMFIIKFFTYSAVFTFALIEVLKILIWLVEFYS